MVDEQTLSYTGGHLNRAANLRKDPSWISTQLCHPETRFVPVWRDLNLVHSISPKSGQPRPAVCRREDLTSVSNVISETTFLGLDTSTPFFAVDLSGHTETEAASAVGMGTFIDLRRVGPLMGQPQAALLAYARGMLHWHRHHRFCGRCGHSTESTHGGHVRRCTNQACGHETFPRTDPAVIMLIEHKPVDGGSPTCLLGGHSKFPRGSYSTLAGFVDPGESLEEAVSREVFEEVGVVVKNIVYQASQPWPFPSSIMLGFRAEAVTTAIYVDDDELKDAHWFTAEEIRNAGEWEDEKAETRLPRRDSIARYLIESWLQEVG